MEESSKTRCKSAILLNQGNRGRAILRNAAEKDLPQQTVATSAGRI